MRKITTAAVASVSLLGITACSATGNTSVNPNDAGYWLLRVQGSNGNIYEYPSSDRPGSSQAIYLGSTIADVDKYEQAAAKQLGITSVSKTILS
jgi:hypothetical protein